MTGAHPKFIQISATARSKHEQPLLFALDEEGGVWEFTWRTDDEPHGAYWYRLSDDREMCDGDA